MQLRLLSLSVMVGIGCVPIVSAQQHATNPAPHAAQAAMPVPANSQVQPTQVSAPAPQSTPVQKAPVTMQPVSATPVQPTSVVAPHVAAPAPTVATPAVPSAQSIQPAVTNPAPQIAQPISVPTTVVQQPANPVVTAPTVSPAPVVQPVTVSAPTPVAMPAASPAGQIVPVFAAPPSAPSAPVVQPQPTITMPMQQVAPKPQDAGVKKGEQDTVGISTIDIDDPQGNWLYKRLWWQRAEEQYEKTKGLVDGIMEARMGFFSRRSDLDRNVLDPFYLDIGLSRGALEEIIETLVAKSTEKREVAGELKPEERAFLELVEAEKSNLELLQKDIQKISDVDHAIDDAVDILIKQINQARNFERQSWRNFKQIAQELSDKKARELYYGMVTYFQNINEIVSYIQGPLSQHMNQLENMIHDHITKVRQAMNVLKEKGVDFKKQEQKFDAEKVSEQCPVEQEKVQEAGIFSRVLSYFGRGVGIIASGLKGLWNFTLGRLFTAKKEEPSIPEIPSVPRTPPTEPEHTPAPAHS